MGRKNRSRKRSDPGNAAEFKVNPFAGLHLDSPANPDMEAAPKISGDDAPPAAAPPLSPEDEELRKAFVDAGPTPLSGRKPVVTLRLERRARGKQVTCISGLEEMDALEQMELGRELRQRLGVGARFSEGILELQGDQQTRAADWLQAQGYGVKS